MEVKAVKKIGVWAVRIGLLGVFFWCSNLFMIWSCYRRTLIETLLGTMIWVASLIGIQILLNVSFSCTAKKQHVGWQIGLFAGLVLMRLLPLLGTIDAGAAENEVITIILSLLPGILIIHGLTQLSCNAAEYFWKNQNASARKKN